MSKIRSASFAAACLTACLFLGACGGEKNAKAGECSGETACTAETSACCKEGKKAEGACCKGGEKAAEQPAAQN